MLRIVTLLSLLYLVGAANKPRTVSVAIKDMSFAPAAVEILVGDSITWQNEDDRDHSVNARDGSFRSGNIPSRGSFSHRFDKPGEFPYGCGYHPRMKGTITVRE